MTSDLDLQDREDEYNEFLLDCARRKAAAEIDAAHPDMALDSEDWYDVPRADFVRVKRLIDHPYHQDNWLDVLAGQGRDRTRIAEIYDRLCMDDIGG